MSASLKLALNDKVRHLPQPPRHCTETLQRLICVTPQSLGQLTCAATAEDAYISGFVIVGVLPRGFAQRRRRSLRIEHVVDNLKREPDAFCKMIQTRQLFFIQSIATTSAQHYRGPEKGARLVNMHELQLGQ